MHVPRTKFRTRLGLGDGALMGVYGVPLHLPGHIFLELKLLVFDGHRLQIPDIAFLSMPEPAAAAPQANAGQNEESPYKTFISIAKVRMWHTETTLWIRILHYQYNDG